MTDLEKIQQLISSQTKENNVIALRLMIDVLGWDFEQAFLKLQPNHNFYYPHYFAVETPNLSVHYSDGYIIDLVGWGYQILEDGKIIEEGDLLEVEYAVSKEEYSSLYLQDKGLGDLKLYQKDLQTMMPKIKELFLRT